MAIEKRNVEATLESKKDELAELEAAIAILKKDQDTSLVPSSDQITDGVVSPVETETAPESYFLSEISLLQKKISEMVWIITIDSLFNTSKVYF